MKGKDKNGNKNRCPKWRRRTSVISWRKQLFERIMNK